MTGRLLRYFKAKLHGVRTEKSGVSAIEFALLTPVLLILFGFCAEASRMYMVYQQYQEGMSSLSRYIVRYPEYELRTRTNAPYLADMVMPPDWRSSLNVKVVSLSKTNGVMVETFSHVLFGSDPGVSWSSQIAASDFVEGENVVFVSSTYKITMLYNLFSTRGVTVSQNNQIIPFFSRNFIWNDGKVANKYVY
jgi:Flp pilus assembly protein TadG